MQELIYGAASFHAVVKPVSITMILTVLAVMYINTEKTKEAGEQALSNTYQVFTIAEEQSRGTSLGLGLVNALIIVCVIGAMTFLLVLLYKYRCMKVIGGYMVIASTLLLGFLGGQMFNVAIQKYRLSIDQISFYFTMYNFAIVGTAAIFYQKGIPTCINQAYLVLTSVIVAWQLSYFSEYNIVPILMFCSYILHQNANALNLLPSYSDDWMAWALLVMLALYDLFAVLTPCGPLKALVKLMSKDDAPEMPGLLYEARLPENATRPGRRNNSTTRNNGSRPESAQLQTTPESTDREEAPVALRGGGESSIRMEDPERSTASQNNQSNGTSASEIVQRSSITLPLALAKVYKLPILNPLTLDSLDTSSPKAYLEQEHEFSASELQTHVEARLPRGGGRIEITHNKKGEPRYVVYNKDGEVKRTLLVNEKGKVMEIVPGEDDEKAGNNNIKLGLGDFIFYSVLVAKAGENGFASFVSCFVSILTGLGGTLVLLAVYHQALPALPISIFVAVIMFIITIYCMEPWIQAIWREGPYYV